MGQLERDFLNIFKHNETEKGDSAVARLRSFPWNIMTEPKNDVAQGGVVDLNLLREFITMGIQEEPQAKRAIKAEKTYIQAVMLGPRKVAVRIHFGTSLWKRLTRVQMLTFHAHVSVEDQTTGQTRRETFSSFLSLRVRLQLAQTFEVGHHYTITVILKKPATSNVEPELTIRIDKILRYKESLRISEIRTLLEKAKQFASTQGMLPVKFAYRNKPQQYFNQIMLTQEKLMRVYRKSNTGDPGCPLNRRIKGLFFSVRPDPQTCKLPTKSPFGNKRIYLPIQEFIGPSLKLYFADFWCHKEDAHHITLVVTKPNSVADHFCTKRLPQLSRNNNPFVFNVGSLYFCCREFFVDLFYTEDVDLAAPYVQWETVRAIGRGSADPKGIPKRKDCTVCNLCLWGRPKPVTRCSHSVVWLD